MPSLLNELFQRLFDDAIGHVVS